jgi:hypothetical protein
VIRGLKSTTFENFIGKNTNDNLADMDPGWLLNAKNCICMGDGGIRKMPGYTLVKAVERREDFEDLRLPKRLRCKAICNCSAWNESRLAQVGWINRRNQSFNRRRSQ